jgi:hypothetical protein
MQLPIWLSPSTDEANTAQLGSFAVFLWRYGMNHRQQGNTYGTIVAKLCAVRWYHRANLGYEPGTNARHVLLLKGIRRFTDPVVKQQPLTIQLLHAIYSRCDLDNVYDQLLWGGLLLGYFFLLRRSEYLFIGHRCHDYVIKLKDITFLDAQQLHCKPRRAKVIGIRLEGAKNNQYGREEFRFQHKSQDAVICPVRGARWIHKAASKLGTRPEEPALTIKNKQGVTSHLVSKTIKAAAARCGLDPKRYSTHSVRIGGATKLLNSGADRLIIKLLGRWLSNCFEEYPVLSAEGTIGLSAMMC